MSTVLSILGRVAAALLVATVGSALAQAPAPVPSPAPEAKPVTAGQRSLRLLPLGEQPPFQQEVRNGIRYELEPAAGSVPPRQVVLGEGETARACRLHLTGATGAGRLPGGTRPVVLREMGTTPEAQPTPWLTLRPPETGNLLALIWRDPKKPWAKPQALLLPDSGAAFPAGQLRIVNLLPLEAALVIGGKNELVGPGKTVVRAVEVGKDLPFHVAYRDPVGKLQRFHSAAILLNAGERGEVVIYRADSESPRRPARVIVINETIPGGVEPPTLPQPPPQPSGDGR